MKTTYTWKWLTHENDLHMKTTYTWKRLTHENDLHMKMTYTWKRLTHENDLHMKTTYTWKRLTHENDLHIKTTYTWKRLTHENVLTTNRCAFGLGVTSANEWCCTTEDSSSCKIIPELFGWCRCPGRWYSSETPTHGKSMKLGVKKH